MTTLMFARPEPEAATVSPVFGGRPSAPGGRLDWPHCRECTGAMQFLGQMRLDADRLALVFMCQNEPGMCDDWEPFAGGNAVVLVDPSAPQLVTPPAVGETTRPERYGLELVVVDADYEEARRAAGRTPDIVGQWGGTPSWLQGEEVPACLTCAAPMSFVAQFEQGPYWRTAMNFGGGGWAYLFRCVGCDTGAFLWQR